MTTSPLVIRDILERRRLFCEKNDQELLDAMGIPKDPKVKIGISMDDVGLLEGESFNTLPNEVIPQPGFFTLIHGLHTDTLQVEVRLVLEDKVVIEWSFHNKDHLFELPISVFNLMFTRMDEDV
jgi:hypothetical protein